jgi:hypothetical protein
VSALSKFRGSRTLSATDAVIVKMLSMHAANHREPPQESSGGVSRGILGPRSVALWTVVGGVCTLLSLLGLHLSSSGPSPGSSPNGLSSGPQSTPSRSAPVIAPIPQTVRYQNTIAINGNGMDLDALPPASGAIPAYYNSVTIYEDAGGRLNSYGAPFPEWTGSSAPTYSQCHNLVLTQGGGDPIQLASGLAVCVLTADGRTAYVKITSPSSNGWAAQVTIWNK